MAWVMMKCGMCGHEGDLDLFCSTPVGGELPSGQFQCPKCYNAWRRVGRGYRVIGTGADRIFVAGRIEIRPAQARL